LVIFFELHHDATGKDNHIASLIAICRSATVLDYENMTKQAAKDGILRGNQHLAVGNIGTRIDKAGQREASKDIVDVRNSPYNTLPVRSIMRCNNQYNRRNLRP